MKCQGSELNLFIPRSETVRKNTQTSSVTPQNALTEVRRIDAFLALFPEELRLLGLSSLVPNGIQG